MDYYLRADSETAMWNSLEACGVVKPVQVKDEAGTVVETRFATQPGWSLDMVGTIYKPTGNVTLQTVGDTTVEVAEVVSLPGFHANLRGSGDLTTDSLEDLLVYPQTPSRVWF